MNRLSASDGQKEKGTVMKFLEDRIKKDGQVRPGNILKVDNFLNHQIDVELLEKIGEEFHRLFKEVRICLQTFILQLFSFSRSLKKELSSAAIRGSKRSLRS